MDDLVTQLKRNAEASASGITPPGIGSDPLHFLTGKAAAKIESDAKAIAERDTRIAQLQETADCIPEYEAKRKSDAKVIADLTATLAKSCDETRYEDFDNGCPRAKAADRVIAALRERMTHIRAFVIVINENNWRDIGDRIARQAAEYEQTVAK